MRMVIIPIQKGLILMGMVLNLILNKSVINRMYVLIFGVRLLVVPIHEAVYIYIGVHHSCAEYVILVYV